MTNNASTSYTFLQGYFQLLGLNLSSVWSWNLPVTFDFGLLLLRSHWHGFVIKTWEKLIRLGFQDVDPSECLQPVRSRTCMKDTDLPHRNLPAQNCRLDNSIFDFDMQIGV
jgi:hypothetical protein